MVLVAVRLPAQRARPMFNPTVDSIFAAYDSASSPGCALGVYRGGAMIYSRGYGMADLERNVPITPATVFDIGSTSKQFAAAIVVMRAADGKLSLDDDVRRYIPELPAYEQPITIRHLLHHTSGLRDYIGLLAMSGERFDDVTTPDDALQAIVRQRELNFTPGCEHLYSNSGYFLLSIIVERVTGESLRDVARERIFTPLGMTASQYLDSYDDLILNRAIAYEPRANGTLRTDMPRWLQLGDGAVFTTVEDLLRWDENFYTAQVGGPAMLATLQTRGVLTSGDTIPYALGLIHGTHGGLRTVAHGGAWGGYRAELLRFPDQHFSVATLCNLATTDPSTLATRVADVYLASEMTPANAHAAPSSALEEQTAPDVSPAVAIPITELRQIAGAYRNPTTRAVLAFVLDEDQLYLSAGRRYDLRPVSRTEFVLLGAPVHIALAFAPPLGDQPRRLTWTVEKRQPETFAHLESIALDAAGMAEYAGTYTSPELQATYTLAVVDGALRRTRRGADPSSLTPLTRDEFSDGGTTYVFKRSPAGAITGFMLEQGRVRNVVFEKAAR